LSWFLQSNVLALERFSLLAKPALRPRMLFRALRPPRFYGASLPGMIFPAQRPAEGSNSYHYGSHATPRPGRSLAAGMVFPYHYGSHATYLFKRSTHVYNSLRFHTTMVLTQQKDLNRKRKKAFGFHTTMVLTQQVKSFTQ